MRRLIFHLSFFIILGVTINVSITWACAIWQPLEGDYPVYEQSWASGARAEDEILSLTQSDRLVPPDYPADMGSRRGIGWTTTSADIGHIVMYRLLTAGWPFRSLRMHERLTANSSTIDGGVQIANTSIPFTPIWPGFVLDSVIFASVMWLLGLRIIAIRQSIRIRRGCCPVCNYPARATNVCSECGNELPPCLFKQSKERG